MNSNGMSSDIIDALDGLDTVGGTSKMWKAICDYVKSNAKVKYSWVGVSSVGVTDPTVIISATIDTSTGNTLSLPNIDKADSASAALGILSAGMNTAAAKWRIKWPTGFTLTPCFVIPTIVITPSMKDNQSDAIKALCTQIINGIKAATPATSGTHMAYMGAGAFTLIS